MYNIRRATSSDIDSINELALASEAHWGGSAEFLETFKEKYKITDEFVKTTLTYVLEEGSVILGFYSIVDHKDSAELEFLYIRESEIGKGYGKVLWGHIIEISRLNEIRRLELVTSPEAANFYIKMGAKPMGTVESLVQRGRKVPKLEYLVEWE